MSTVKAPCKGCDDSTLVDSRQITIRICTDDRALNHYDFTCPRCGQRQANAATDNTIAALINADCLVTYWSKTDPHPGPPIGWDDLLDFHQNLDRELEGLLRGAA